MLTVPEAARLAGKDAETIRRWIRGGRLRSHKVGTQHLIEESDLEAITNGDRLPLPKPWGRTKTGEPTPNVVQRDARLPSTIWSSYGRSVTIRKVGVAELKSGLSRYLREVEEGEAVQITDHGRPVALLVPIEGKSRLVVREPTKPFSEIAHKRYPPLKLPISSTELLRQDRDIR